MLVQNAFLIGRCASLRLGWEIRCLPYAGFFLDNLKNFTNSISCIGKICWSLQTFVVSYMKAIHISSKVKLLKWYLKLPNLEKYRKIVFFLVIFIIPGPIYFRQFYSVHLDIKCGLLSQLYIMEKNKIWL